MEGSPSSRLPRGHDFHSGNVWRTLGALYRPERWTLAVSTFFWFFKSSPTWVLPVITANVIDLISAPAKQGLSSLWWNAAWGTVVVLQHGATHVWHYDALSRAVRRTETRLRDAVCRHLQQLSISYHKHTHSGTLQLKVMRDVENIGLATRDLYHSGLYALCTVAISLAVTAQRAPWFVPVLLLTTPLAAGLYHLLQGRLGEVNQRFRVESERLSARLLGMLEMIPVTRAHSVEEEEMAQIERRLDTVEEAGLRLDRHYGAVHSAAWVVFTQFGLAGLIFTAWLSYRQVLPLTPGDVVLVSGYFGAMTTVLIGFLNMLPTISRGLDSVRSLEEVLRCDDLEENRGKRQVACVRGAFDFQNVRFAYPGQRAGEAALADFSLRIEPGETLGIVGASGAGKSTLIGLLLGFHRPVQGRILLDGVDMDTVDLHSFRRWLAVVSQETLLFEGTVRENILYGVRHVDEDQLRAAIEDANAADFIERLPQGIDTPLGEGGARLSGGQRQRIAIARALIRSPRVLVLDEATSALDAESEAVVQDALDRLMAGRTTFIVAHRLSTLRRAQRIVVLRAGRLVELGSPDELINHPAGEFSRLHFIQASAATDLSAARIRQGAFAGEVAPEYVGDHELTLE